MRRLTLILATGLVIAACSGGVGASDTTVVGEGADQSQFASGDDTVTTAGAEAAPSSEGDGAIAVDLEIAQFGGDVEAEFDIRPELSELVDAPHQPFGSELCVERDLQRGRAARHLARPQNRTAEQVESVARRLEQHRSRFGQPDRPAGAGEQSSRHRFLAIFQSFHLQRNFDNGVKTTRFPSRYQGLMI